MSGAALGRVGAAVAVCAVLLFAVPAAGQSDKLLVSVEVGPISPVIEGGDVVFSVVLSRALAEGESLDVPLRFGKSQSSPHGSVSRSDLGTLSIVGDAAGVSLHDDVRVSDPDMDSGAVVSRRLVRFVGGDGAASRVELSLPIVDDAVVEPRVILGVGIDTLALNSVGKAVSRYWEFEVWIDDDDAMWIATKTSGVATSVEQNRAAETDIHFTIYYTNGNRHTNKYSAGQIKSLQNGGQQGFAVSMPVGYRADQFRSRNDCIVFIADISDDKVDWPSSVGTAGTQCGPDRPWQVSVVYDGPSPVVEGDDVVFSVTLDRRLAPGERVDAHLEIGGVSGADVGALEATGRGVSLTNAATLTPMLRFDGDGAQTAHLRLPVLADGLVETYREQLKISIDRFGVSSSLKIQSTSPSFEAGSFVVPVSSPDRAQVWLESVEVEHLHGTDFFDDNGFADSGDIQPWTRLTEVTATIGLSAPIEPPTLGDAGVDFDSGRVVIDLGDKYAHHAVLVPYGVTSFEVSTLPGSRNEDHSSPVVRMLGDDADWSPYLDLHPDKPAAIDTATGEPEQQQQQQPTPPSPPPSTTNTGGGGSSSSSGGSSGGGGATRSPVVEGFITSFGDVAQDGTHTPAILALAEKGIFVDTECRGGRFCPSQPLLRWTMAVWLIRILEVKAPVVGVSRFADVGAGLWWLRYVEALAESGITVGCSTDPLAYCPDGTVTRAQMASFLVRAFDLPAAPEPVGFTDVEGTTHTANIEALAHSGITVGCSTDPLAYCPRQPVTRAQMATFLHRAVTLDNT